MNHVGMTAAAVMLALMWPASGRADMGDDCAQEVDRYLQIFACAAVIDSGQRSGADVAWAHYNRGNAYSILGDYARAIEDYDRTLDLDPEQSMAYTNRGVARIRLGDYQRAIEDFDQALRLDPGDALAHNNRGDAHARLGEYERAIEDHEAALATSTTAEQTALAHHYLAWALYLDDRAAEGLPHADEALRVMADFPHTLVARGHILAELGRSDDAIADFEQALQLGDVGFVQAYEDALLRRGFDPGPVDGIYGPATRAALEACLQAGCRFVD